MEKLNNPESVLENKMLKLCWDFELLTDHLILARQPDVEIVNFAILADYRVKLKDCEKKDKYLDLENCRICQVVQGN